MNALLTGASGFVGRNLVELLLLKKVNVYTIGRHAVEGTKHYSLPELWCNDDLANIIREVKPDFLFHLAGNGRLDGLREMFNINTYLGVCLLNALTISGFNNRTKCLFFGSAAEYGLVTEDDLPLSESFPCKPYNDYGFCKLTQTNYVSAWLCSGGRAMVVRPFTILGKHMPVTMAIGSFASQILNLSNKGGQGVLHTGNLNISRDFVDVSDVVSICWELINIDDANGEVINICSGKELELKKIVDYMIQLTGFNIKVEVDKDRLRTIDTDSHYGDNRKLLKLLGGFEFIHWKMSVKQMMGVE
jgi:nucleoside-diphosphate-sugar epimerase